MARHPWKRVPRRDWISYSYARMAVGPEQQSRDVELLAHVPEDGSPVGNTRLRTELGWDDDDLYWSIRNRLLNAGVLELGRGRGGSVKRVLVPDSGPVTRERVEEETQQAAEQYAEESALYQPMRDVIEHGWAKSRGITPAVVEIIAHGGSKPTGTWKRPDVVSVAVQAFTHLPGKFIEVATFEIKPSNSIDVLAVYEALSHRQAATHAYVLLHVPVAERERVAGKIEEVSTLARSHGIGLIVAEDPRDFDAWEELVPAQRVEPEPADLERFMAGQLKGSDKIAELVR
jgi:hypothetical protein